MGDVRTEPPAAHLVLDHHGPDPTPDEVTVLITGFGVSLAVVFMPDGHA